MSATPLAGLLVVDLSRHLPGPYATRILCDLGARVVKIEEPELGDPVRQAPPFRDGTSALAAMLLAGVESLALDPRRDGGRRLFERLLGRADVLVESLRPGGLERLVGASPEELLRRHPRLVVCSISGWGQAGPHAGRAGHDLGYQALAGLLAPADGMPALPAADLVGGWSAATAILAALHERESTGSGTVIDTALVDAAAHANLTAWAEEVENEGAKTGELETGRADGEPLALTGAYPCYRLYRTRDGKRFAVACLEPRFWKKLCRLVERRDLVGRQYRRDHDSHRRVAEVFGRRTADEWQELFAAHDLPGEPVLTAAEARAHPQTRARGLVADAEDGTPRLAHPALLDGQRPRAVPRVPELGEDTDRLLAELGGAEAELGRRARRAAGIGRRRTLKGTLWRLASKSKP